MEACRATSYQNRLSPIISREEDSLSSGVGFKDCTRSNLSGSSCTTTSSASSLTHDVVTETLRDVINLQHSAMRRIRDDAEKQKLDYVLKVTYDDVSDYSFPRVESVTMSRATFRLIVNLFILIC